MSQLSRIANDLREKRLWPIALVLLAAIVAVPVLLSVHSHPGIPAAQLPQTGATASQATALPAVSVQSGPSNSRLRGPARDPFAQQPLGSVSAVGGAGAVTSVPALGGGTTSGVPASGSAAATTGTSSGSTAGGAGSTTAGTPAAPGAPQVSYLIYSVDLSFGQWRHASRVYRDVARLAPFPSPRNPVLVYLGVKPDAKTVVFLITSTATPSGSGKCTPAHGQCELLNLKVGQTERLAVLNWNGTTTKYVLKVSAVHLIPTGSVAAANLAHARASVPGRQINLGRLAAGVTNGVPLEPPGNG